MKRVKIIPKNTILTSAKTADNWNFLYQKVRTFERRKLCKVKKMVNVSTNKIPFKIGK
uniref:Uncharacterized protein n=1 Tax=viral metagenome TaxID=1070528 RepID=A0A6C0DF04_9ZZZZ